MNDDAPLNADRHGQIDTWAPGRITDGWWLRPSTIVFPVCGIFAGTAAIILGAEASKAFENFGGGATIRVMGVLMLLGGLAALVGIARADRLIEIIGHALIVTAGLIYACGVIAGLGSSGVIAGIGYSGIVACLVSRILAIMTASRK